MKPKRQFELDKDSHLEQTFNPEPESELWVEAHLAPGWWKHPVFDNGSHYPMPYIWFGYWLITWEEEEVHPFNTFQYQFLFRTLEGLLIFVKPFQMFHFIRISISFMPD